MGWLSSNPAVCGSGSFAFVSSLEIAARLAALHAYGATDAALEAELLADSRVPAQSGGVWSDTDAFVNAIGLLAVTTKPGVTFSATDWDGDGAPNAADAFPYDPSEQADRDGDGVGDLADLDDDGDGVPDGPDPFPADPTEWADRDGDATGDNADLDDDADGVADLAEHDVGTHPQRVDSDGDRFVDGADGVIGVAQLPSGWDLDNDSHVDGEQSISDPTDPLDHPGEPGDLAPLGHPDARLKVSDMAVLSRALNDGSIVDDIPGAQNRQIAEGALDANGDGRLDAGDALWVLQRLEP